MCYSSSKDFGWGIRKETEREPETKQDTQPARSEPDLTEPEFKFWAFVPRRKAPTVQEPAADRSFEKV
jgi:hypothetical protein